MINILCLTVILFLLISVCYTDIRYRKIKNSTVIIIALFSLCSALTHSEPVNLIWPVMIIVMGVLLVLANIIGAGDIKLIAALSLSLPGTDIPAFIFLITLSGVPLILVTVLLHKVTGSSNEITLPYGVAISCGYLFHLLG